MPVITLPTFEARTYDRLDSNGAFFPTNEVDNAINEALRVTQCFTAFSMGKVTLPNYTDAYRVIYDVPPGMSVPLSVYFNGRALKFRSLTSMATEYRNWASQDSSFAGQVSNWAPIGTQAFVVQPADAAGGASLEIYGVLDLAPLVSPTDVAPIQDEYLDLIADYAAHVLLIKMPGRMFAQGLMLYQAWQRRVQALAHWRMGTMPGFPKQLRGVAA